MKISLPLYFIINSYFFFVDNVEQSIKHHNSFFTLPQTYSNEPICINSIKGWIFPDNDLLGDVFDIPSVFLDKLLGLKINNIGHRLAHSDNNETWQDTLIKVEN